MFLKPHMGFIDNVKFVSAIEKDLHFKTLTICEKRSMWSIKPVLGVEVAAVV